ncbi:hypothetical protein RBB50_005862 [Rhinocladiella similis]
MTGQSKSTSASCRPSTAPKTRKVKTGCRTCKVRKVKCDESRPACRRCLQTGRVCDGYGIWGGGNKALVPNHATEQQLNPDRDLWRSKEFVQKLGRSRPRSHDGDPGDCDPHVADTQPEDEAQVSLVSMRDAAAMANVALRLFPLHLLPTDQHGYLEWYMRRTAPKLPGAFKETFWNELLPQASQSEPAILHAVLSLGSIHKRAVFGLIPCGETSARDTASLFTLQQLTLATGSLRDRISNRSKTSLRVAIIACAVFIQLEYLQDNYQTSLTHLRHGLILLEEFMLHDSHDGHGRSDANDESIINTFVTLLIQARLLGQDVYRPRLLPLLIDRLDQSRREFESSARARRFLERVFLRIFSLVDETKCNIFTESLSGLASLWRPQIMDILQDLCLWLEFYERSMMKFGHTLSALDFYAWKLLLLHHTLACVVIQDFSPTVSEHGMDISATQTSTHSPSSPSGSTFSTSVSLPTALSSRYVHNSHSGRSTDSVGVGLPGNPCLSVISQCAWLYHKVRDPASDLHEAPTLAVNETAASSVADIGWMPALFYTAILARDTTTRREAARLLYLKPHREGIWDSYLSAVLAEKIIEIKQDKITLPTSTSARNLEEQESASNTCRLRDMRIELPSSSNAKLTLTYARRGGGSIAREESWSSERCMYDMKKGCWIDELCLSG